MVVSNRHTHKSPQEKYLESNNFPIDSVKAWKFFFNLCFERIMEIAEIHWSIGGPMEWFKKSDNLIRVSDAK